MFLHILQAPPCEKKKGSKDTKLTEQPPVSPDINKLKELYKNEKQYLTEESVWEAITAASDVKQK